MAYCSNCGATVSEQAAACMRCGHPNELAARPPVPVAFPQTDGYAIAALICGISAFVVCPIIPAIVAIVLGNRSLRNIRESNGALTGDGLARAGLILGIINVSLIPLMFLFVFCGSVALQPLG